MTSSGNDGGAAVASSAAGAAGAAGTGAAAMASRSDYAIDLAHVAKTYRGRKKVRALRGIEMRVHRGEVFGLLGPNGAGKSTLVKILMTVISPSECHGTMLGEQVGRKETLGRVGYLAEHHRFPDYLTGAQVLDFFGAMAKVPGAERKKRIPRLLELVGMKDWANQKIKSYSKGMRQRVGIAQALMNEPDLILLDEPTDGVDPVGRRDIRNLVQHLKDEGKTVFVNSHLLSELEMVCDRVAILVQGVVSKQGTLDELTSDKQRYEIEVAGDAVHAQTAFRAALPGAVGQGEFQPAMEAAAGHAADAPPTSSPLARRVGLHGNLATGEWVEIERNTLRVGTTDPAAIQPILDGLRERGVMIKSVRPMRPSLEDLFMEAVTDPMTGEVLKPGAADGPGGGARHSARGLANGGGGATGAESADSSGGEVRP